MSKSQFGFRSGCSTLDAIFTLRRRIDLAWAQQHRQLLVLALDWQKAFDSIDPSAMIAALRRFGLPQRAGGHPGNLLGQEVCSARLWTDICQQAPDVWDFARVPTLAIPFRDADDGADARRNQQASGEGINAEWGHGRIAFRR